MSLLRFLGMGSSATKDPESTAETRAIRSIASRLEQLEPETARYLAGFAYVLARVAHADLDFSPEESRAMESLVSRFGALPEQDCVLVVEIAKAQARLLGETENYLVTREFRKIASRKQRSQLLKCLFAVAAADGNISGVERTEIFKISQELGFTRHETNAIKAEFKRHFTENQNKADA